MAEQIRLADDSDRIRDEREMHDVVWRPRQHNPEFDEFLEMNMTGIDGYLQTVGSILISQPFCHEPASRYAETYSSEACVQSQRAEFYYSFDYCCPEHLMCLAIAVAKVYLAERMAVSMPVHQVERALDYHASCREKTMSLERACEIVFHQLHCQIASPLRCENLIEPEFAKLLWDRRQRLQRYFHIELPLPRSKIADPCA